jgi:hypothetical protein
MQGQPIIGLNTEEGSRLARGDSWFSSFGDVLPRAERSDQNITEQRNPVNRFRINDGTNKYPYARALMIGTPQTTPTFL